MFDVLYHLRGASRRFYYGGLPGRLKNQQIRRMVSSSLSPKPGEIDLPPLTRYFNSLPDEFMRIHRILYPEVPVTASNTPVNAATMENHDEMKARYVRLQKAMPSIQSRLEKLSDSVELQSMVQELKNAADEEMLRLALDDIKKCSDKVEQLEEQILDCLIPEEAGDEGDLILEVKAGVGGQEAMLFASDIFLMYERYATFRGWSFSLSEYDKSELGGVRSASASLSGSSVYRSMKFESGVHRVQRVPKTEKFGRLQTSTVTVAVLPKPTDIEIVLRSNDLRIETCRATGKGGQHVNKTDSAVRIVHLPTNIAVECQEGRSQISNKQIAMEKLSALLYQRHIDGQQHKVSSTRKLQVASSDRSEKIRTYNFPQDRLTDHRNGYTTHNLEEILRGSEKLHELVQKILHDYRKESVEQLIMSSLESSRKSSVSS